MGLHGQGGERGYAMAALLVALAIMAVLMTVAMPVWRQEARREKEAELVFRGEQYARAIALYKNKNGGAAFPGNIDVLVSGKYLRKKYKDPMTKDGEFQIMPVGAASPQPGTQPKPGAPPIQPPGQGSQVSTGGIMGVRSKSTENSLRSYRGATRYDQWAFRFDVVPIGRAGGPGTTTPDGRGNQGPGGRGPGTGPGRGPGGGGPNNPGGINNPRSNDGFQPPVFPGSGNRGTGPRGGGAPGGGSFPSGPRGGRGPGD
jgi:type II secretory pathway pseudopilin PulG